MRLRSLTPIALTLLAAPSVGQLSSSVGPPVAPEGCPISISLANDTNGIVATGICPYQVFDDQDNLVYSPFCILIAIQMPPGSTFSTTWDQIDNDFDPVPPGVYRLEIRLPDNTIEDHVIEIADVDSGMAELGVPKLGKERALALCSPGVSDATYVAMASLSSNVGIPTCGGTIPLDFDDVWLISLNPTNGVFNNFVGTLDIDGLSTDPSIAVPNLPSLLGVDLTLAYMLYDGFEVCPFSQISEPLTVTIE